MDVLSVVWYIVVDDASVAKEKQSYCCAGKTFRVSSKDKRQIQSSTFYHRVDHSMRIKIVHPGLPDLRKYYNLDLPQVSL